jgi:hypothetical protein
MSAPFAELINGRDSYRPEADACIVELLEITKLRPVSYRKHTQGDWRTVRSRDARKEGYTPPVTILNAQSGTNCRTFLRQHARYIDGVRICPRAGLMMIETISLRELEQPQLNLVLTLSVASLPPCFEILRSNGPKQRSNEATKAVYSATTQKTSQ